MQMNERRRTIIAAKQATPSIRVGENLYSRYAAGVENGVWITNAVPGTASISKSRWEQYLITAPMPYSSRYVFYTNATTVSSSGCIVLDRRGVVVSFAKNGYVLKGAAGQEAVKSAESQLGLKGVSVICSTIDKNGFIFRREL